VKYFKPEEFLCQHCQAEGIQNSFVETLDAIREECNFPFVVNSGYRCADHPIEAKKEKPGAHQGGYAADISVRGERALKLIEVAIRHGVKRVGINQKGGGRFVHIDTDPDRVSPAMWSY